MQLDDLFHLLSDEKKCFEALYHTLVEEYAALQHQDAAKIQQLSEQKNSLLAQLQTHIQQRQAWLTQHQLEVSTTGMNAFLETLPQQKHCQLLRQLWQGVIQQHQQCLQQNEINGRIIHVSRRQTDHLLHVLKGNPASGYDASGEAVQQHSEKHLVSKA